MSKNIGCRACNFYARGGKSRIAMEHTCGREPKKKDVTTNWWLLDRKAFAIHDKKISEMCLTNINQFTKKDIEEMNPEKWESILQMITDRPDLFDEKCWRELEILIKDTHGLL